MDIVATFLVGFGGVLVGGALAGFLELWRRGLDGQAAARLIRIETVENRVNVERAVKYGHRGERVARHAWNDYRLAVTPFLDELQIMQIAESYSLVDKVNERWFEALKTGGRTPLNKWVDRLREDGRILRGVEIQSSLKLALRLLKGRRTATSDEIATAYGATKEEVEAIKSDLEGDQG